MTPYSSAGSAWGSRRRGHVPGAGRARAEGCDDVGDHAERVGVVVGEVVGDTGDPRVQITAAELLGGHHLAGRGLHQRRAAEEDRALVLDDHRLVAHRGHVGAAGGAGAEHGGDLRNAALGHGGLVVEDPAEVLPVGEHLVLAGQERAAGIDQVHAGQVVVERDLLGAQVLLDRHRVVGAALDGGVVGDDHALAAGDPADPGDEAGGRRLVVVHPRRRQRRELKEGGRRIDEGVDPVPGQQLAPRHVPLPGLLGTSAPDGGKPLAQLGRQRGVDLRVALERRARGVGLAANRR